MIRDCHITHNEGLTNPHCSVMSVSDSHTQCLCNICDSGDRNNRKLLLDDVTTSVLGVVAVTVSSATTFVSVVKSVKSLNTVEVIESTTLVIATFAALWLGLPTLVALVSMVWQRCLKSTPKKSVDKNRQHIVFVFEKYLNELLKYVSTEVSVWNIAMEIPIVKVFLPSTDGAMWRSNRYLKLLQMLSNITFGMFLLAFFYIF